MAEENFLLVFAVGDRAQLVGHAEPRDHGARHTRGLLNIVHRAGRHLVVAEGQFLGDAAAESHAKICQHFLP